MDASDETVEMSLRCRKCGEKMVGIFDYAARKYCDRCGTTEPRPTLKLPWRKDDD